ncbi:MAG: SRPBCC family protein [Myxococcota bacterium]|nr:SRPBCC family protein [Myxococcota bacterium]
MFLLFAATAFAQEDAEWAASKKVIFLERSVWIHAPAETVRATASDLHTWQEWTAWNNEVDPECTWEFVDVDGVVGDEMSWDGPELKTGRQVLTGYTNGELAFDTYFGKNPDPSSGRFLFEEVEGGTQVTWQMRLEANLFLRLFRKSMEQALGRDFEEGLAGLKEMTEAQAAADRAALEKAAAEAKAAEEAAAAEAAKAAEEAAAQEAAEGAEGAVEDAAE